MITPYNVTIVGFAFLIYSFFPVRDLTHWYYTNNCMHASFNSLYSQKIHLKLYATNCAHVVLSFVYYIQLSFLFRLVYVKISVHAQLICTRIGHLVPELYRVALDFPNEVLYLELQVRSEHCVYTYSTCGDTMLSHAKDAK